MTDYVVVKFKTGYPDPGMGRPDIGGKVVNWVAFNIDQDPQIVVAGGVTEFWRFWEEEVEGVIREAVADPDQDLEEVQLVITWEDDQTIRGDLIEILADGLEGREGEDAFQTVVAFMKRTETLPGRSRNPDDPPPIRRVKVIDFWVYRPWDGRILGEAPRTDRGGLLLQGTVENTQGWEFKILGAILDGPGGMAINGSPRSVAWPDFVEVG